MKKRIVSAAAVVLGAAVVVLTATGPCWGMYHPQTGRWLQRDPEDYREGTNLQAYVNGNPTLFSDPTGLGKDDKGKPGDGDKPKPKTWKKAHFLHTIGTYWHDVMYVGHSGMGCEDDAGDVRVYDYVGGASYRAKTREEWVKDQAGACPAGCNFTLEDLLLKLPEDQVGKLCNRLAGRQGMKWDWEGDDGGDNCNSSIVADLKATTDIKVPHERGGDIVARFTEAGFTDRWGRYTVPWLRNNGWVEKETTSKHACTGGGAEPGDPPADGGGSNGGKS